MEKQPVTRRQCLGSVVTISCGIMAGCLSDDNSSTDSMTMDEIRQVEPSPPENVTVSHWYTSLDAETFQSSIAEPFYLSNYIASNRSAHESTIADQLSSAEPPETFLTVTGLSLERFVITSTLHTVDPELDKEPETVFQQGILETIQFDDGTYAVPIGVDRTNWFFVHSRDPRDVKGTLTQFLEGLDAEKPLLLPTSGPWSLRLFCLLVLAKSGAAAYAGIESGSISVTALREAIETQTELLHDYTQLVPTQEEALKHFAVSAGTIAFATAEHLPPANDWDLIPFPGTANSFVGTGIGFVFPKRSMNPQGTMAFLETIATKSVQSTIGNELGMLPGLIDVTIDPDHSYQSGLKDAEQSTDRFIPALSTGCGLTADVREQLVDILQPARLRATDPTITGDRLRDLLT